MPPEADHAELHRDHALHVHGAAAVDLAVGEVAGERVVRPALGRGRDHVEMRQEQQRVAAGPVTAEPDVDRPATRDRLDDLGFEAGLGQPAGDAPRDASSPSGRAGSGGLTDGMAMSARSVSTSVSWARSQVGRSDWRSRGSSTRPPRARPGTRPRTHEHEDHDHGDEQTPVVAVLPAPAGRIRVVTAGDIRGARPSPGRARCADVVGDGVGGQRVRGSSPAS